ncbi:hypothetical protein JL722_13430 [Aureococcus anophagefferens]|nr:hypothetical protein JL722_13430 [Aureococcus anophagefferens]
MISKARKVELGWRMLEAHVAAGRGGVDYAGAPRAHGPELPAAPFDMAAAADALLIPRVRTCPSTTSSPSADRGGSGPTRRPTATARRRARALYGKAVPIGDHFCGKLERSLVPAIRSRVPDDKFRRFWFQYWIVRGYQIPYFEEHHDFAYRTWGSPCCWQRLNWAQPAMSLSVLVDLNTTCLVDPNVLGKHDKNSNDNRPTIEDAREGGAAVDELVRAGGGWSLRRDRPDKPPGWIVNATATATSELSIVVPCGHTGTVGLEYLRSYEGMGSVTATFATIDVEKIKFNELICAGDDECAAYAAAPGRRSGLGRRHRRAQRDVAPGRVLAVVRQFKVACQNYAMMWNPVVVKLRPDPGDRGKFKLLPSSRAKT